MTCSSALIHEGWRVICLLPDDRHAAHVGHFRGERYIEWSITLLTQGPVQQ